MIALAVLGSRPTGVSPRRWKRQSVGIGSGEIKCRRDACGEARGVSVMVDASRQRATERGLEVTKRDTVIRSEGRGHPGIKGTTGASLSAMAVAKAM